MGCFEQEVIFWTVKGLIAFGLVMLLVNTQHTWDKYPNPVDVCLVIIAIILLIL